VSVAIALQEPARLLQHLFYFIAHETTSLKRPTVVAANLKKLQDGKASQHVRVF